MNGDNIEQMWLLNAHYVYDLGLSTEKVRGKKKRKKEEEKILIPEHGFKQNVMETQLQTI